MPAPLWILGGIIATALAIALEFWFALPCIAIAAAIWLDVRHSTKQLEEFLTGRGPTDVNTFEALLDDPTLDRNMVREVHSALLDALGTHNGRAFPLYPDDRFTTDLRMDEDDIDLDVIEWLSQTLDRSFEPQDCDANPYMGRVHTPRDLLKFCATLPQKRDT